MNVFDTKIFDLGKKRGLMSQLNPTSVMYTLSLKTICYHKNSWTTNTLFYFSTVDILTCRSRRCTGVSDNTDNVSIYSETKQPNTAVINLIIYTCALSAVWKRPAAPTFSQEVRGQTCHVDKNISASYGDGAAGNSLFLFPFQNLCNSVKFQQ